MIASIFLSLFMLFQVPTVTPTASPKPSETPRPKTVASAELLDEELSITKHSMRVGGRTLNYTVTTGYMPVKNERTARRKRSCFLWLTRSTIRLQNVR